MKNILTKCTDIIHLKKGGQKNVYKAKHAKYGEVVLKHGTFNDLNGLSRIQREVDFFKKINSQYFPKHYEFKIDEKEKAFLIVEEYIESKTLNEYKEHFDTELKLIILLKSLIQGLKELWKEKVVHRDLKPDNILITEKLDPIIIDLGIAKFMEYPSLTKTIAMFGPCTKIYATPEQLQNRKHAINVRTDFFALGIIILELHLGFHPFVPDKVGNKESIPQNILDGIYVDPSLKPGTSKEFVILIKRLLKTYPHQRFPNYNILETYLNTYWS